MWGGLHALAIATAASCPRPHALSPHAMIRFAVFLALAAPAAAQPARAPDAINGLSGLPTPRFASLRSGQAYMRTGPGRQYPVTFVYRRRGLPVEIVREYGIWRQVRDPDGTLGWMDKGLLSGERTAYVARAIRTLHAEADANAPIVWRAEPGVVARVLFCAGAWCRISVDGRSGYILRKQVWGVYPNELIG